MSPVLKVVKTKFSRSSLEKKVLLPIVLKEEDCKVCLVLQTATRVSNNSLPSSLPLYLCLFPYLISALDKVGSFLQRLRETGTTTRNNELASCQLPRESHLLVLILVCVPHGASCGLGHVLPCIYC